MAAKSLGESRVSTGFLTVIPRDIRRATGLQKGDSLRWELKGTELRIRIRRRPRIEDITALGRHGGDAVASKKAVQGLVSGVR